VAQLAAEIAQLLEALRQQQIGVAADLIAPRFAITPERAWTVAADKATDVVSGVAQSNLRIAREQP
jgi:hypothetical protein